MKLSITRTPYTTTTKENVWAGIVRNPNYFSNECLIFFLNSVALNIQ